MGRLLAGTLITVLVAFAFAGPARAAEIPPTAECTKLYKKLSKGALNSDSSEKQTRKGLRELVDADCISDPEPLLKRTTPKPFSEQCVDGARAANRFWQPATKQIRTLNRGYAARSRALNKPVKRLSRKLRAARKAGASRKQLRRLQRKKLRAEIRAGKAMLRHVKSLTKVVRPTAYPSMLIVAELISRRCIGQNALNAALLEGEVPEQPVAQAFRRNVWMIWMSALTVAFDGLEKPDHKGSVSARLPQAGFQFHPGQAPLELVPLPGLIRP